MQIAPVPPVVRAVLLASLQHGEDRRTACRRAGITDRTLRRWLVAGRAGDARYVDLVEAVDRLAVVLVAPGVTSAEAARLATAAELVTVGTPGAPLVAEVIAVLAPCAPTDVRLQVIAPAGVAPCVVLEALVSDDFAPSARFLVSAADIVSAAAGADVEVSASMHRADVVRGGEAPGPHASAAWVLPTSPPARRP